MTPDEPVVTGQQVLTRRYRVQQLDRDLGSLDDTTILGMGVQDTGPDGARWALVTRGVPAKEVDAAWAPPAPATAPLAILWTLRGAPHLYRREDLPQVQRAMWPWSSADAAKRVFDAAKPLRDNGIDVLEALDVVARTLREVVHEPTVKGQVSSEVTQRLPPPYVRDCRPCGARHLYEQTFRLGALGAGLELAAGTSPPVLVPVPGLWPPAPSPAAPDPQWDVVRLTLHLLGPATPQQVAAYLDSTVTEVRAHWPADAVPVHVQTDHPEPGAESPTAAAGTGQRRWVLAEDLDALLGADPVDPDRARLLGPYDLFLQGRDRDVTAPASRHRQVWPVLGRPGVVLAGARPVGTWRPRASGRRLSVRVEPWHQWSGPLLDSVRHQADVLGRVRGARTVQVEVDGDG